MAIIILKQGREKSLRRRHPWVFSGAVARIKETAGLGETVEIVSADGAWLARGAYSPQSQIAVRIWSFDQSECISSDFFKDRLSSALCFRKSILDQREPAGVRLVNAESDALPGLIVDRYGEFLVCQFLSTGVEFWKPVIVEILAELTGCRGIFERSDVPVRKKEGLPLQKGVLFGQEPPELLEINEGSARFLVDVRTGHKTGFYLDQRENRRRVAQFSRNAEMLNCFSYTGGFGVRALAAGAHHLINIDASESALEISRKNFEINAAGKAGVEHMNGDVFEILRNFRDHNRRFDLVILDPPKFAESRAQLMRAARGYKDINYLAFQILRPGGMLFTFSCSGAVSGELFQKIVADAALDAGRKAVIIADLNQAPDHPVALNFPEARYLKGLHVCTV